MRNLLVYVTFLSLTQSLLADAEQENSLKIHRAMSQAQVALINNKPSDAIRALEAVQPIAKTAHGYVDLLQEAYQSQIDLLKRTKGDALTIQGLEQKLSDIKSGTVAKPMIVPPPPPVDDPAPKMVVAEVDIKKILNEATDAFSKKDYLNAEKLFRDAYAQGATLNAQQKEAWAYCRLDAVTRKLNDGAGGASLTVLSDELDQAILLGGDRISQLAQKLKDEISKRKQGSFVGTPEEKTAWQELESDSFRVRYTGEKALAQETLVVAEECRKVMIERWSGAPSPKWSAKCEITVFSTAKQYSQATGRTVSSVGHSQANIKGGVVEARSISLHQEESNYLDTTLPREITHLVIAEMFADAPVPRWADIGMAALSEPNSEIARSLRATSKMASKGNQLYTVDFLLKSKEIPTGDPMTIYYAESVSLVHYLVKLKGAKTFSAFLREAPRRGFDSALKNQYGFRDAKELQDKWLSSLTKGD